MRSIEKCVFSNSFTAGRICKGHQKVRRHLTVTQTIRPFFFVRIFDFFEKDIILLITLFLDKQERNKTREIRVKSRTTMKDNEEIYFLKLSIYNMEQDKK